MHLSLITLILLSLLPTSLANPVPIYPPTPSSSSTPLPTPTPTLTPEPLLPPSQFNNKVLTSPQPFHPSIPIGYLTFPSPRNTGSIPFITSSPPPTPLFFNRKNLAGLGWISNGPVFFAPDWLILSWSTNTTSPPSSRKSKVYLDDLVDDSSEESGFVPLIFHAVEGRDGKIYITALAYGLPGTGAEEATDQVVFSWDADVHGVKTLRVGAERSERSVVLQFLPVPAVARRDGDASAGEEGRKGKVAAKLAAALR